VHTVKKRTRDSGGRGGKNPRWGKGGDAKKGKRAVLKGGEDHTFFSGPKERKKSEKQGETKGGNTRSHRGGDGGTRKTTNCWNQTSGKTRRKKTAGKKSQRTSFLRKERGAYNAVKTAKLNPHG